MEVQAAACPTKSRLWIKARVLQESGSCGGP